MFVMEEFGGRGLFRQRDGFLGRRYGRSGMRV